MSLHIYLSADKCQSCGHISDTQYLPIPQNLAPMARRALLYMILWCPDWIGVATATEAIPYLEAGIINLNKNKKSLEKLNLQNGEESHQELLSIVDKYLRYCKERPNARVGIER